MSGAGEDLTVEFNEGQMVVCSQVLRLASPVFAAMLASEMDEAVSKRVKVEVSSKEQFAGFYKLLLPGSWDPSQVTVRNVDFLLALSDYYQVEFVKQGCEARLNVLTATVPRLIQAQRHGLQKQYGRCLQEVAQKASQKDLKALEATPGILMEVTFEMRRQMDQQKRQKKELRALLRDTRDAAQRTPDKAMPPRASGEPAASDIFAALFGEDARG
mmetsp:Transcript_86399/g.252840  ORF Transcript_86399/g.252840 Transcript_86399/m.252840 type:complete len:215 (-) Transcript_86399:57-701(-)